MNAWYYVPQDGLPTPMVYRPLGDGLYVFEGEERESFTWGTEPGAMMVWTKVEGRPNVYRGKLA